MAGPTGTIRLLLDHGVNYAALDVAAMQVTPIRSYCCWITVPVTLCIIKIVTHRYIEQLSMLMATHQYMRQLW